MSLMGTIKLADTDHMRSLIQLDLSPAQRTVDFIFSKKQIQLNFGVYRAMLFKYVLLSKYIENEENSRLLVLKN